MKMKQEREPNKTKTKTNKTSKQNETESPLKAKESNYGGFFSCFAFAFANYFWVLGTAWTAWTMVDVTSDTPLEKYNFPLPRRYQF